MKTKTITSALCGLFLTASVFAQDRTTVTATSYDVSDNLDLKAVASIFGDSRNLEDFEQRLNNPDLQISNLDLNNDNEVDYLRVIESVEGNTHLVIVQAVLDRDVYQDVATIEVEKDGNNVQVQVVGDVYMYGPNYIYEPVYVSTPVIYSSFWAFGYRPYYSSWYYGYYPSYYHVWRPFPVYRYRTHIHNHINVHNHYNYVSVRRSRTAEHLYNGRRSNGYEKQHPDRSFASRNNNASNRYELDKTRKSQDVKTPGRNSSRPAANSATRNSTKATRSTGLKENKSTIPSRNKATIKNGSTTVGSARSAATGSKPAVRNTSPTPRAEVKTPARQTDIDRGNTVRSEATAPKMNGSAREASRPVQPARTEVQRSAPAQREVQRAAPQVQRQAAPQQSNPKNNPAPQRNSGGGQGRNGRG